MTALLMTIDMQTTRRNHKLTRQAMYVQRTLGRMRAATLVAKKQLRNGGYIRIGLVIPDNPL